MTESKRSPGDRGTGAVEPAWRMVLERHLGPGELHRLRQLSQDWRENPFEFGQDTGRFQVTERWLADGHLDDPASEADLDLVLKACDILSDHLADLGSIPSGRPGGPHEIGFRFEFVNTRTGSRGDDAGVAERFLRLLRGQEAYRVRREDRGQLLLVWVEFDYRSDFEYQSKKSQLDWTLELARRLQEGRPFKARRL